MRGRGVAAGALLTVAPAPAWSAGAAVGTVPGSWLLLGSWGLALGIAALCAALIVRYRKAQARALSGEAALDALDEAVLLCDGPGRALAANRKWRERFGAGAGLDVLQAALDDISPLSRLRVAIAAGDSAAEEIALPYGAGRRRWWRLAVGPAPGMPGAALWRLGDAAARNALDDAVAAQYGGMVGFLDDIALGCAVVADDGTVRAANAVFARWLGSTPEAMTGEGMRIADFVADERDADLPAWCALPSGDEAGPCAVGEAVLKDLHGRRFVAQISQVPIGGRDGYGALLLVRDISGEHDLEASLRHAEARFHRFFDEAPVGIALLDTTGTVAECSKAFERMASAGPASAAGQPLWAFVADDDRDRLRQWFAGAMAADDAAPLQVTFRDSAADGRDGDDGTVAVSLFARRYEADDGAPGGVVVHALDQTEQRSIENQFFQSQKMELVGQLAGGVAHDFNNLLTAMIGFCDLLLQRHSPKDQSFADIMQIKQNANRAANLVRQLLAFSRQQTLQPRVLDITNVLAELSHLLRRLIGANIELEMVHSRDLGPVKVDQSQLEQVIINLVVNARDAIGDGGHLAIRTRNLAAADVPRGRHQPLPVGDYVVLEIEDNGCGIAKEHLDKIFEPFFTTKEVGSGTGLGLSTVYGIIKQTGGHIFVDSEAGRGTCFSIYLPRFEAVAGEESVAAAEAPPAPAPARDLTGVGSVMLVEDEDAVRMFGARALRNKGYSVQEAASGDEALELLANGADEIDVLITDVVMPGLDGPSMIRKVRETHPALKVIFISGYTEDSFRKRLDVDEDVHFLPKPFTLEQLAGKVKEIMSEPSR